jgi:hypothetical protein
MGGGLLAQLNIDCEPVAGNEPTRGRQQDRKRDLAGIGLRKQHAQRIALVEMREPRRAAAPGKPDFGDASDVAAAARPRLRPRRARRG